MVTMKRNKEVDQETREAHELIETYILKSQNEHFHKLGYQVFDFANNVGYYWDLSRNGHYLKVWNIIRSEHNFVYTVTQFVRGLDAEAQNPEIDEGSRGCARGLLHVCEKLLHRATALHLEAQEQALQAGSGMEARQDLAEEERMWADEAPPSWAFLRTYHLIQANVFEVGRPARPPLMPWDQKPVELSAGEKGSDGSSSAESGRLAGLNSTEPASTGEVSTEKEGSSHVPQSAFLPQSPRPCSLVDKPSSVSERSSEKTHAFSEETVPLSVEFQTTSHQAENEPPSSPIPLEKTPHAGDTPRAKALAAYLLEDFPSEEDCSNESPSHPLPKSTSRPSSGAHGLQCTADFKPSMKSGLRGIAPPGSNHSGSVRYPVLPTLEDEGQHPLYPKLPAISKPVIPLPRPNTKLVQNPMPSPPETTSSETIRFSHKRAPSSSSTAKENTGIAIPIPSTPILHPRSPVQQPKGIMEALTFTSTILPRTKIDTRLALASAKTRTSATRVQAEKHRTLLKGPQSLKVGQTAKRVTFGGVDMKKFSQDKTVLLPTKGLGLSGRTHLESYSNPYPSLPDPSQFDREMDSDSWSGLLLQYAWVQAFKRSQLAHWRTIAQETIGKEECLNLEGNHDAILKAGLFDQWRQRALGYEYDANRRTQSNQGIINSNVLQEAKRSQKVKSRAKAPLSPSSTSQPPGPTDELERLLALKPRPQLTYDSFMFNMNQASAYEALSRRTKTEPSSVELAWFESFIRRLEKYVEACTIHRNLYLRALREMPSALLMGCLRFQEADLEVLVADAESVVCQQPTRRRGETTPSSETDQERAWRKQFEQDFPYGPKALQTRGTGLRCAWYALQLSIKHQFPDVPVPTLHELQSIFNHLADSVHPDLQMSNSNMFRIDQAIRVGVAWLNRWNVEACVGVAYKNDDQLFYAQIPVQNFDRRLHRVLWIHNDNLSVGDWSGAHFSGLRGVTMQESEERLAPLTWSLTRADEPSTVRGWRRLTRNLAALDRHKGSYGDEVRRYDYSYYAKWASRQVEWLEKPPVGMTDLVYVGPESGLAVRIAGWREALDAYKEKQKLLTVDD